MKLWNFLAQNGLQVLLGGDPDLGYVATIAPFDGKLHSAATTAEVHPHASGLTPRKVLMDLAKQLERCKVVRTTAPKKTVTANTLSVD